MSPLLRLTATETRLFLREPIVVFFALAFAPVLLVVLGLIPSMREDSAELGGVRPITLYLPIVVSMGIALFALSGLSQLFASYREKGVLRRLRTTPVAPGVMLGAQLLMATALSLVTLLVMLTIGRLAFDVDLPRNLAAFLLGYLLMASAMFAVGLLVAALAPTGRSAGAMGSLAFFPLVFFAGLMALSACLVAVAPWYGFSNFVGYPLAFRYLRGRRRYVGAAVTAMISAAGFMGGVAGINAAHVWWAWLAVGLISAVLAGALFHFVEMDDHRNTKQKRALSELHRTNAKLEAALAENAGLRARLMVQAREAGVLDERQRMAREIHDTLAQGLAGVLTQLQAAEQTLDEPRALGRHLANATNLARESLVEARRTVHAVEPAVLADARLPDAIGEVARRWSEINHVDTVLTTTGDARPMHAEVEVTLLRTAQEALANVAKHARAGRVGLTLSYMEDLVTLDVRDDGVGFDPDARRGDGSANGGFGLAGMRRRVQRLAGRLVVESEPGGGTAISAAVPAIPAGGAD